MSFRILYNRMLYLAKFEPFRTPNNKSIGSIIQSIKKVIQYD